MKIPASLLLAIGCLTVFSAPPIHADDSALDEPSWIWTGEEAKPEEKVYFRHPFEVPGSLQRAILVGAGDNRIDLYINGERRAIRSTDWKSPVVEDITDRLKKGSENLIAGRGVNAGGVAGVLVMVELTLEDGSKRRIVSDKEWTITPRPEKGWNEPGYRPSGARAVKWRTAVELAALGEGPWSALDSASLVSLLDLRVPEATAVERISLPEGFEAELLYSVPKADQGSWVAMTIDDRGRLIVSDQYGALYRIAVPPRGEVIEADDIEEIPVDVGGAQGLLCAFDSLYVVLNTSEFGGRGLYRVRDTDGDDQYDEKELLRKFEEVGGEHGPHAVVLGPDGESLYIVAGNQTPLTEVDSSRVPRVWDEDQLLPRPYGRGFMKGTPAPGGWVAKTDPDGKNWELISTGFRNQYDVAFNHIGDLFTYDADMEWDMNTPWYRPTRINHIVSGSEFGWRNGGGKWPDYYPDSVGSVVDIGPGSPTGVVFGYGAEFPEKYQNALYAADWSYGKLYAVHLEPSGGSYEATFEEFMSAQPLPLTDLVVNPDDGAMYIAIGGRRVQSGLYRVTYHGDADTSPAPAPEPTELQELRRSLEDFHRPDPGAVAKAWSLLGHEDRSIRYAARVAIEHQPVEQWSDRAAEAEGADEVIQSSIALARVRAAGSQGGIVDRLSALPIAELDVRQRLDLLRAYGLVFTRLGEGSEAVRSSVVEHIVEAIPFATPAENLEALQLAVYLQHPEAAEKGVDLLLSAPSQEEQMGYAKSLRHLEAGWNRELRRKFFEWFTRAKGYKGGASFSLFIENMKKDALARTPEEEKVALKETIEAEPPTEQVFTSEPRSFVKAWTVSDFDDVIHVGLEGNRDFANGRRMFGSATCFACHRFNQEGGAIGPDLTSVAGKFSPRDLLESILEPSKEISDQYGQMIFEMKDGSVVMGRIMNLSGDSVRVNTNMMNPDEIVSVDRKRLESMKESPVSMMPPGLLNTLDKDDVLDLLAYLLSQGNPEDPMFAE